MATTATTMRIPDDLAARYERLAKSTGRTKIYYMTKALQDSIDSIEYEYGLLQELEDYRSGKTVAYSSEDMRGRCNLDG